MKIVIPGGSGQIGTFLARHFHQRGDEVVVLTRSDAKDNRPWKTVNWSANEPGDWSNALEGADVLINLCGRSVNCRYTAKHRKEILDSRIDSTKALALAVMNCVNPLALWLQSSTATIYAHRFDQPNDEITGIIGGGEPNAPRKWDFSIEVAKRWEETFQNASLADTRKIVMRSAVVLSPDKGGIFDVMRLVRYGLGGTAGSGKQYISWIHDHDFVAAIDWLIDHPELEGIFNLSSPEPLPNEEFMQVLRRSWGAPIGLPATELMLEAGGLLLQTETELVLKSRRVVPSRLLAGGFSFKYPRWEQAAADLCSRWRLQQVQQMQPSAQSGK